MSYSRKSQNLAHSLLLREANIYPRTRHPVPSHFLYHERNIYKSITPRMTILNVEQPLAYLRKFTPDGKLLLAFSDDQKGVDIYAYQGVENACNHLNKSEDECVTDSDESFEAQNTRKRLFDAVFLGLHSIPLLYLTPTPAIKRHFLNRDCSLFVDDGHYAIVASAASGSIFPTYLSLHDYPDLYDDTELCDYTFFLVDIRHGYLADTIKMDHDFVVLSHNHSLSLYGHTLAIFSTYRQCIELIDVNMNAREFKRLYTIGPFGSSFDRARILSHQRKTKYTFDPYGAIPLSHFKQKILAYLYRECYNVSCLQLRRQNLRNFYKIYPEVERMIIMKMQLYDHDHLLLRYEKRPPQMSIDQTSKNFKYYVFYNISQQKILKIYSQYSIELVKILRSECDDFRNARSLKIPWHASSPSNNEDFRASFDNAFNNFSGGLAAAISRFNSTLPISSQSFSTSPYLDYSLFKYDDRYISTLERPRNKSDKPLEFLDRETNRVIFRAHLEQGYEFDAEEFEVRNHRDLVSYIFHPFEPFFISVQKFVSHNVLNFHIYNPNTKVELYISDENNEDNENSEDNENNEM